MTVAPRPLRVLYVQYADPSAYPPIAHGLEILAGEGVDLQVLGLDYFGGRLRLPDGLNARVTLRRPAARGWRQKVGFARFGASALARALQWHPDWIYASDPLSTPAVRLMQRFTSARVVYHEHDSPGPGRPTSPFMRRVLESRKRVARTADVCVLPNDERARVLRSTVERQVTVTVWNTPLRREVVETERPASADSLRVVYHGSIVPARVPLTVVDALARLPRGVTLSLAGYETGGHPGYTAAIRERAAASGVGDRVSIHGEVPLRDDLLEQCRRHEVGLALMPNESADLNERFMVGASNKPFDYLACGLPLLVADLPDWRRTFVDPGFGTACNPESAASIADRLMWYLQHPAERQAMGAAGRRRIVEQWHYERSFAPVFEALVHAPRRATVGAVRRLET